jgi:shikimate dehydrogenase
VNTILNKNGKLHGFNTDAYGLQTALVKGIKDSKQDIKTAIIYGNGGVSGVAFKVLQDLGIKVTITGRNPDKVLQKLKELGIDSIPKVDEPYDILIDATPISSSPDIAENTAFIKLVDNAKAVFCHSMPEKDGKTNFLLEYCNNKGIFYIAGKEMYKAQLIKQYKLYFDNFDPQANISEVDIVKAWGL